MGSPAGPGNQGEPGNQNQGQEPQNQGEPGQQQSGQQQSQQSSTDESAAAKAYEKLRQVEDRERQLKAEVKQKDQQLTEAEQKAQRADALDTENAELRNQLQTFAAERLAASKGFVDAEAAVATLMYRKVDISDQAKASKALDDLATEKGGQPNQNGGVTPPSGGPINPPQTQTPAGDAGMNQIIRQRAGRA